MGSIVKAVPVIHEGGEAVAEQGIIQILLAEKPRHEQIRGIDDDRRDQGDDTVDILPGINTGQVNALFDQFVQDDQNNGIIKEQVHPVEEMHLVAVAADIGGMIDIADGNFPEGIDGENQLIHHGDDKNQNVKGMKPLSIGRIDEIPVKNQHGNQGEIDAAKIDAGKDGISKVILHKNADGIAQSDHKGAHAGNAQGDTLGAAPKEALDANQDIQEAYQGKGNHQKGKTTHNLSPRKRNQNSIPFPVEKSVQEFFIL